MRHAIHPFFQVLLACSVLTLLMAAWVPEPAAMAHGSESHTLAVSMALHAGSQRQLTTTRVTASTGGISIWAGYHDTLGGHYWASGQFKVPDALSQPTQNNCNSGDLGIWVGIGGGASNTGDASYTGRLVQAGLNRCPLPSRFFIEDYSLDDDTDHAPYYNHPVYIDSFSACENTLDANNIDGHIIVVYVSSNWDVPNHVYFSITDLTTYKIYTCSPSDWPTTKPGGAPAGQADWEMETCSSCSLPTTMLPITFSNTATSSNGQTYTAGQAGPFCDTFRPQGQVLAYPGPLSANGSSFSVYPAGQGTNGCNTGGTGGGGGSSAMPPPSIVMTSSNQPDVFYQVGGYTYQRVRNSDGSWAGPWPVGTTNANIAGAPQAFNQNLVYARSTDNWIRQTYWTGSAWSDWQVLPSAPSGGFVGDPYLLHNGGSGGDPNYPEIFATAVNGNVYHTYVVNGAWVGWLQVSAGAPVLGNAVPWNSGRIYARTSDGQISQTYWTASGYSAWGALPGTPSGGFIGDPVLVTSGSGGDPNYPEIFATGANGHVYHTYVLNGAWIGWYQIADNTALTATPAVLTSANLYANSGDCIRDAYWIPNAYSGWWCLPAGATPGGGFAGQPVLTAASTGMDPGYPDVYAVTADAHLYHTFVVNGFWVPWSQVA